MKKAIISICIAALSLATAQQVQAQKNENAYHNDSYYLKGAVPEENGKVVFSKEFSVPGKSKSEIFDIAQEWMNARMEKNANKSRVAYVNEERGQVAANGEEYIVFSNTALALDRTKVLYQLIANCDEEKCVLQIKNIRYDYPNEKEIYVAEEWITDKLALSKDQTKLVRGYAKWRRKTIDWVDDMDESLQRALSGFAIVPNDGRVEETRKSDAVAVVNTQITEAAPTKPAAETVKPIEETKAAAETIKPAAEVAKVEEAAKPAVEEAKAVAQTVNPVEESVNPATDVAKVEEAAKPAEVQQPVATPVATPVAAHATEAPKPAAPSEAFPELTADKILASNGRLVIIIGDDEFNRTTMTANAGGYLSSENGKKYINTILTPDQNYQTLEQTKEYMVAFYPNGAKQPSVVMRCLNVTKEKPGPGRANIFVGEITNVETR